MTATELLTALTQAEQAQLAQVRRDYPTLEAGTRLMRRHGSESIEAAMRREARQRVLREGWATVTREVA